MHVLEAGDAARPCVLLLHGFPELAYSWRKVMPLLAAAGYYALAPDQRGYGLTTGWDGRFDCDLAAYRMPNLVQDAVCLLDKLEIKRAHVVGHDFGSPVAAHAALTLPDRFRSVVLMSAPFGGTPIGGRAGSIHDDLAAIGRKHYQWYYSTREADGNMRRCPQGVHAFLRAYYHHKSADWPGNRPFPLAGWTASELAKMPTYYIMELDKGMAETVAPHVPASAPAWPAKSSSSARCVDGSRRPRCSPWPWISTRLSPSARNRPTLAGSSLTKARLFPSAPTWRRSTIAPARSTAMPASRRIAAAGWPLDAASASLLYAGLYSDTGGFSLPTVTAETMETAAALVRAGADVGRVGQALRWQQPHEFDLVRTVYANTRTSPDRRVAYSPLTLSVTFNRPVSSNSGGAVPGCTFGTPW